MKFHRKNVVQDNFTQLCCVMYRKGRVLENYSQICTHLDHLVNDGFNHKHTCTHSCKLLPLPHPPTLLHKALED